ncbi:MAG TPA: OmpA family protein [Candidatus Hydrogenedentes bacterium]|nr:OmpA family protein [Candidatus Hydrogenedentota bacterium]HNT87813.1 OmpA family protein [Candidatus Hydrogenedentota bacterium]
MSRGFLVAVVLSVNVIAGGCQSMRGPEASLAAQVLPQPNEYIKIDNVILIVDASGSMCGADKFPLAKELARSFATAMPSGDYTAAMLAFGGETTARWIKHNPDRFDRAGFLHAVSQLYWLKGSTPLALVLERLKPGLDETTGNTALVIFSDGRSDTSAVLDVCTAIVNSYPAKICIHTVQFGDDPAGGTLLENMAVLSACGMFRPASHIVTDEGMQQFVREVFLAQGVAPYPAGGRHLGTVYFNFDKCDIRPDAVPVIDAAAATVNADPQMTVSLDGHTDARGAESYNQTLSEKRSDAVRDALEQRGVAPARMRTQGFGESQPAAPNDTPANRQLNRRVEIKALP